MARALTLTRTLATAGAVAIAAALILALHAASALLAFTPDDGLSSAIPPGESATPLAAPGGQAVGVRRLPTQDGSPELTIWYPAADPSGPREDEASAGVRYAYGIAALSPGSTVTLATYPGRATPGAPADTSSAPFPVVVLSPGFAISANSYGWLAEHLASHGFVVAAVRHAEPLDPGSLWTATADRPQDVTTALDRIEDEARPGGSLAGVLDLAHVGVLGHSYGGYAALAAGGAQLNTRELLDACAAEGGPNGALSLQCDGLVPHLDELAQRWGLAAVPAGSWPTRADSRIDAVITLAGDAAMFGAQGLASIDVPLLTIGGTADADAPFLWGTRAAFEHASSDRKAEVALVGAEHLLFAGDCAAPRLVLALIETPFCSDATWSRSAAHDVIAQYTTAFLRAELLGDADARNDLAHHRHFTTSVTYRQIGY